MTKNIENEQVQENIDKVSFNLENDEQVKELSEELKGNYFKPENDVTYKFTLNSPKIEQVEKDFNGDKVTKYALDVTVSDKSGEVFKGIWEVGAGILKVVSKNYVKGAEFKLNKSGEGLNTKYNVLADF